MSDCDYLFPDDNQCTCSGTETVGEKRYCPEHANEVELDKAEEIYPDGY
jgi:hypothetical protein